MFSTLRRIASALELAARKVAELVEAIHALAMPATTDSALEGRVAELERRTVSIVGEAEALVFRAESQLKAARAAEERERRLANTRGSSDEGDDESELAAAIELLASSGVQETHAQGSNGEGVPAVHQAMGRHDQKSIARNAKWGNS